MVEKGSDSAASSAGETTSRSDNRSEGPAADVVPEAKLPADVSAARSEGTVNPKRAVALEKIKYSLEHYLQMEDLSWGDANVEFELQNLRWTLRSKHEEAMQRARGSGQLAGALTIIAIVVAVFGVVGLVYGWWTIDSYVTPRPGTAEYVIPDRLWQIVIATTTTLLLIGAAATLLFRVARSTYGQKAQHEREADFTRQIEVAVRLALCSSTQTVSADPKVAQAFRDLAIALTKRSDPPNDDDALPEGVVGTELLKQLTEFIKSAKGGRASD